MEARAFKEEKRLSSLGEYEVLRTIRKDQNEDIYEAKKKDSADVSLII